MPETGELEKIETQWADNRLVIERRGAVLGEELSDGLSAWNLRVRRPDWERLLERVESGESDGIVVWHIDRLFRQPRDLERLIELADKGFLVLSAHGARDLSDPDDRFILRIEVAHAARSSDDTSRRLKRKFAAMRAGGRAQTGGPRRFGFDGVAVGPTGKRTPVPAEQVERERQALRDAVESILAGGSIGQVTRDWNAAGLRTVPGGLLWERNAVRATLERPVLAGLIEYKGVLEARVQGDPIIDPAQFERLQALFASRSTGAPVGERYLGTGIVRCGLCGAKLSARPSGGKAYPDGTTRRMYFCNRQRKGCGKVYADQRGVDREIHAFTVARLSDPRVAAAMTAARARVSERLDQVEAEIASCTEISEALAARLGARKITLDAFDKANEPLTADLARLTAERDSLIEAAGATTPTAATGLADAVADQWANGEIVDRRAMFTRALGTLHMVIDPVGTVRHVFDRTASVGSTPKHKRTGGDPNPTGHPRLISPRTAGRYGRR
ncbi:recombinase family protein [Actinokineospora inagensis]|uniref:recombinase family protein n=1 Tax=Actinokineospora inagensis TaxID=103730 RepID=UPI000684AE95|nr:recombinase family protein [Actinokineospora inagensis]